jgi:transcriptional regulator with XRE-family HTH domain
VGLPAIDFDLLATHLKNKLDAEGLSVRTAADLIGISAATLSRMLRGTEAPNTPDAANIFKAVSWLRKTVADFDPSQKPSQSSIADVEVHLRALPDLTPKDKEALVAIVKAAHDTYKGLRSSRE